VLIRFLKPCALFCLRLLFCAVVSDIVPAPSRIIWTGGYYKRKQKYVKQKPCGNRVLTLSGVFGRLLRNLMKKEALLINVIGDAAFFHCDGKEFLTKRLRLHST